MINPLINQYFDKIELCLLGSIIVDNYNILRKDVSDFAGKIRIRVILNNMDLVDLFEYVIEDSGEIIIKKYHFHWQDNEKKLKRRWDNAPHHTELPNFPHHVHYSEKVKAFESNKLPDILFVIEEIEKFLNF